MSGCEGCQRLCPAILAADQQIGQLEEGLHGLAQRANERAETREQWDRGLADTSQAEMLRERYVDGEPVGGLLRARDAFEALTGIQEQSDEDLAAIARDGVARLRAKVEARQAACSRGPDERRVLGVGAIYSVCRSAVQNDDLPNRSRL